MNNSRVILRDIVIALGVLALVLGGLFAFLRIRSDQPVEFTTFTAPAVPSPQPVETPPPPEPKEIARHLTGEHRVVEGQSFSLITGIHWDDIYLWPDLYVLNEMKSGDPDLIFPDEIVKIFNRLGYGNQFAENERAVILEAYIEVYDRFKALGPHKDDSAWTLLWCGAKYDKGFLDLYAHRIAPDDLVVARRYIEEEGYLD